MAVLPPRLHAKFKKVILLKEVDISGSMECSEL